MCLWSLRLSCHSYIENDPNFIASWRIELFHISVAARGKNSLITVVKAFLVNQAVSLQSSARLFSDRVLNMKGTVPHMCVLINHPVKEMSTTLSIACRDELLFRRSAGLMDFPSDVGELLTSIIAGD